MNWPLPRMPEGDVRVYTGRELTELAETAGYSALRPGRRARLAARRVALTRALLQRRCELGSPRPRAFYLAVAQRAEPARDDEADGLRDRGVPSLLPVSYTHLTLPTNREV